jgi:hypothetical protein
LIDESFLLIEESISLMDESFYWLTNQFHFDYEIIFLLIGETFSSMIRELVMEYYIILIADSFYNGIQWNTIDY